MDEAHKLRNCYRESNKVGQALRSALEGRRKLLLTATPLQNSLIELYGISTLLDADNFGDLASFRSRFVNAGGDLNGHEGASLFEIDLPQRAGFASPLRGAPSGTASPALWGRLVVASPECFQIPLYNPNRNLIY